MRLAATLAFACATGACVGTIEGAAAGPSGALPPERPPSAAPTCSATDLAPLEAPTRRLGAEEYRRAVEALFPGATLPSSALPPDGVVGGFDNNESAQGVTPVLVERLAEEARAIADAAIADDGWATCALDDAACVRLTALELAARAYRRPLETDEEARFESFLARAESEMGSPRDALGVFVEALLQSPSFVYRPEVGDASADAPPGLVALAPHELATRLAFFLSGEPPDQALGDAADDGSISDPRVLEAEARRLLDRPRAREVVRRFHTQWLQLERLEGLELSADHYPELDDTLRADLRASTEAYLEHAFFEGRADALFRGRTIFVNDRLAAHLGLTPPGTDALVPVEAPEGERAGLLTQPGLLASTSHGLSHSPILRGVLILERVLCDPPPPPPPDVEVDFEDDEGGAAMARTTREKLELTHGTASCQSCHGAIDGMGFSFERYDALGRYRLEEHGVEVDPSGVLRGEPLEDALDLAEHLASDDGARLCVARHWLRFALGRTERMSEPRDRCVAQALSDTLDETGDPREMLIRLVTSPVFRFLPEAR